LLGFFEEDDNFLLDNNSMAIDHHVSNDNYCKFNFIDSSKWAVALIIYDMIKKLNYKMNEQIAKALLFWIYTDTWALAFSSVNSDTFFDVAEIIKYTDELNDICNSIFFDNSIDYLKILWIVFSRFKIVDNVWISYIKKEDLNLIGAILDEDSWISGHLNSINHIDYVMFFYEKEGKITKCSIRTPRSDFDLTKIAEKYWGWWHRKAAGFSVKWDIKLQDWYLHFGEFKIKY